MNTIAAPRQDAAPRQAVPAPASARAVLRLLQRLQHGTLRLELPDATVRTFGDGVGPHVFVRMTSWKPFAAALKSGDIGFAESYIAGDWTTPDLASLLRFLLANRQALDDVIYGSWGGRLLHRLRHLLNRNTRRNSRRNIHAHYDLGNAFYRLWLDRTMNYSSALFRGDHALDLSAAQDAKVRRALDMTQIGSGSRVLEIGSGWGALAEMAVREYDAHYVGVTLSTEQLDWARARLAPFAAPHQAEFRLQDYRDVDDGPFDAVCSIEMLEAVGQAYWPTYFAKVAALLRPGARACVQSIVIDDKLFERYVRSTDFIQQYVFPGGCLPSPAKVREHARQAGLAIVDELPFGRDYAETCRRWRAEFLAERDRVLALGFDERFLRIWEFYLAYCEAGFDAGDIDVIQFTLAR